MVTQRPACHKDDKTPAPDSEVAMDREFDGSRTVKIHFVFTFSFDCFQITRIKKHLLPGTPNVPIRCPPSKGKKKVAMFVWTCVRLSILLLSNLNANIP